jgi:predicted component of type VI protein secretion system
MLDELFNTVEASNSDAETVWIAALALGVAALRNTDELNRERLLRGVERDLREDLAEFERRLEAKKASSDVPGWPQWTPA